MCVKSEVVNLDGVVGRKDTTGVTLPHFLCDTFGSHALRAGLKGTGHSYKYQAFTQLRVALGNF